MYPIELTKPMSQELTDFGFNALESSEDVTTKLSDQSGTSLLVINSVLWLCSSLMQDQE